MKNRLFAVSILALALASPALAQTTGSTGEGMPGTWRSGIGDAFFSDRSGTTVRSQDEMRTRWGRLSGEQQRQAHLDCQKMYPSKGETALHPKTGAQAASHSGGMVTVCNWISGQK